MYGDCFAVQREHRLEQSVVSIKPNKYTPTDFFYLSGLSICLLQSNYAFLDSRGRLSLQGEIKLPYEKQPFSVFFIYNMNFKWYNLYIMLFLKEPLCLKTQNGFGTKIKEM